VLALPTVAALAYALGHLGWYLATPLGRVPVLDERENLDLANAIFGGQLAAEPFYRAPGYALLLAGFRAAGVSAAGLFPVALVFGTVLHAVNATLVAHLARGWFGLWAGLAAGLLFALDPVFVHYATQALDATLSLTLFLAGFSFLAADWASLRLRGWVGASWCWALATLVRPNFLLPWLVLLAAAGAAPSRRGLRLAAVVSGALWFAALAGWQARVAGVPGFLPWQGPYNLWAANRPGSNGRYYTQRVSLPPDLARANPARAESVVLYQQDEPGAPTTIAAMNAHWRARFWDEVRHHPLAWLGLLARKAYAFLNNWEQYNNKTYAFHKALSPWLSWNPLCWAVLLLLGIAGYARLLAESPSQALLLGMVALAVSASVILFFVSARFRLPVGALLAALAGGAIAAPRFWAGWPARRQGVLAGALAAAAAAAFTTFGGVADRSTYVQDHALLARAAFTVGDDATALAEANAALALQPWHPDAQAIATAARRELAQTRESP
jgi:hypothetical protein